MKTTILTIALALASALSALAQTVMRENSTVYFQKNVYLHDDPTNALHTRISVEGKEPLWVAASNQVAYYQSSEMTNAWIHARYLYSTNATLSNANIHATALNAQNIQIGGGIEMKGMAGGGGLDATISLKERYGGNMRVLITPAGSGGKIALSSDSNTGTLSAIASYASGILYANDLTLNGTLAVESNLVVGSGEVRLGSDNAWIKTDGTNLFFVSTVGTGFTNALTTNAP